MAFQRQLALAAWGDPLDTTTWSGTSAHLAGALKALDIEIIGLNCRPSQAKLALEHAAHRLIGQDIYYTRRRAGRRACAALAPTLPASCAGIVHMSSVTVPPRGSTPGVRHFLLCDAMNDYWQKYSTSEAKLTSAQRHKREADEIAAVAGLELFFPIAQHVGVSLREVYGVGPEKITVVGTGRGKIAPLQTGKDYRRKNILMVAAQRFEDKGGPLLLEALQIARKTDPELHLTLVSPLETASFVGEKAGITLTGRVEWSELQRLFDEACLYAMPALSEPWGLVYAEALATKTPILGLNRAALPELTNNGEYGFLVEDATPEAVAAALLDAISDPASLQKMGESGQKYCLENFTWERTANLIAGAVFA